MHYSITARNQTHPRPQVEMAQATQTLDGPASVRYLCSVAAELNDIGADLHEALASAEAGDTSADSGAYDESLALYKEGVSAVMEAVDGGISTRSGLTLEDVNRSGARRMEMLVRAKETLHLASGRRENGASSGGSSRAQLRRPKRSLRQCMFSSPDSACDSGPLLMTTPVKTPPDHGSAMYLNPSQQAHDLGSVTLCNIGLLQLHKATSLADKGDGHSEAQADAAIQSATKFFRMAAAAGEGSGGNSAAHDSLSGSSAEVDRARVQSLNNLGHGLYLQGKCEEAAGCFRSAEDIVEARRADQKRGRQQHHEEKEGEWDLVEDRIVLLCNIARAHYAACDVHSSSGACQDALELCLRRADSRAKQGRDQRDDESAIASGLMYNLALIHEEQGMPDQALSLYGKFIEAVSPHDDASSSKNKVDADDSACASEVVTGLIRVLLLECRQLNSKKSHANTEDVAAVLRHLRDVRDEWGSDHPALASVLRCAGSALAEREEFKRALPFLLESVRLERAAHGSAVERGSDGDLSADIIVALNAVGECYHGLERQRKSAEFYAEARDIHRSHLEGMLRSAAAQAEEGNNQAAASRSPASVRFIVAVTAYNGGRVQFELAKREAANDYFDEALTLVDGILACPSTSSCPALLPECGSLRHNIGQYKLELGRTADALACFQGALSTRRAAYEAARGSATELHHLPGVAETLYQLGSLHHQMGDDARALDAFRESLSLETSLHGESHPSAVLSLYSVALVRYSSFELERSLPLFRQVLSILTDPQVDNAAYAAVDPALSVPNLRGWVGTVLGEMGLVDEAREQLDLSVQEGESSDGGTASSQVVSTNGNGNLVDPASFVRTFLELADWRPAAAA